MGCDMCGKETKLFITRIEGSELKLCKQCSVYGEIVRPVQAPAPPAKRPTPIQRAEEETVEMIVQDYAEKIKRAREKSGLKQEDFARKINEKASLVHKMESGRFKPSLKLAKKLESSLGIKLIEEFKQSEMPTFSTKSKSMDLTVGDLINIKKR